jgi:uncharacterized protein (TIGR03067 family)
MTIETRSDTFFMKNFFAVFIVLRVLIVSAAENTNATKAISHKLDGTWKPAGAMIGGVRLPQASLDAITLKISGTNYEVTVEGEKEPDRGTSKVFTNTIPKRMSITSTNGPNRGKTFLAIYETKDENSLRVCYDLSGAEFPKEFKAPKGTQLYLVGYRRQKEQANIPKVDGGKRD